MSIDKIYRFFVSSTFTDLEDIRNQVMQGVLKAGHMPVMMEGFSATATQKQKITKEINTCDAYILVVGSKYGTIDKETGLSFTEWEYNYALDKGIPIFTMILTESYIERRMERKILKPKDLEITSEKYQKFVKKASSRQADFVDDIKQVKSLTEAGVMQIIKDYGEAMTGWVSGSIIENLKMTEKELEILRQTRNQLQVKLTNAQSELISSGDIHENGDFDSLLAERFKPKDSDSILEDGKGFIMEFIRQKVEILKSEIPNHRGNISLGYSAEQKDLVMLNIEPDYISYVAYYKSGNIEVKVKIQEPWSFESVDLLEIKEGSLYSKKLGIQLSIEYLNTTLDMYMDKKNSYNFH